MHGVPTTIGAEIVIGAIQFVVEQQGPGQVLVGERCPGTEFTPGNFP